jgi:molybdopterin-guanine dinucleotide biosynthesis protein A
VGIAVVVLAGGESRRWAGRDKTAALLGGVPVLEHAVRGFAVGAGVVLTEVVVVAPPEHPARPRLVEVRWIREEPAGGGPVAGLAAAVGVLPPAVTLVVVGAGDAPFGGEAVPALLDALQEELDRAPGLEDRVGPDGAIGVDPGGREQPLLAVYRVAALRAALPASPAGTSLRDVVGRLRVARVLVGARAALDLDTPDDLAAAERLLAP